MLQESHRVKIAKYDGWVHGWVQGIAKDGYIKDDVESRLEVSKSLGLYLGLYTAFFVGLSSYYAANAAYYSGAI